MSQTAAHTRRPVVHKTRAAVCRRHHTHDAPSYTEDADKDVEDVTDNVGRTETVAVLVADTDVEDVRNTVGVADTVPDEDTVGDTDTETDTDVEDVPGFEELGATLGVGVPEGDI